MPNATYRISVIGRGGRRSAVGLAAYGSGRTLRVRSVLAAAAYRAGETLRDHRQEQVFDYTDRDDVRYTAILAPEGSPPWVFDRETLWNAVEQIENRKNSQLARSVVIALPRELDLNQNIALLREHVLEAFVSSGMIADIAIHEGDASDGGTNPHAHILLSLRSLDENGEWAKHKNREWNGWETKEARERREAEGRPSLMEQWREAWEAKQNTYLEAAEIEARISMKSYAEQGINRVPQVHLGPRADLLERQGIETAIGERNRDIVQGNAMREVVDAMFPEPEWEEEYEVDGLFPGGFLPGDLAIMQADEVVRIQEHLWESEQEAELERER